MNEISPRPSEVLTSTNRSNCQPPDPDQERRRRRSARWLGLARWPLLARSGRRRRAGRMRHVSAGGRRHAARTKQTRCRWCAPRSSSRWIRRGESSCPARRRHSTAATLFARATGYISKRNVDIGSHVHAGDVLAVIAAPDLDQQLPRRGRSWRRCRPRWRRRRPTWISRRSTNVRTSAADEGWLDQPAAGRRRLG